MNIALNTIQAPIILVQNTAGVTISVPPTPAIGITLQPIGARGLPGPQGPPGSGSGGGSYTFSQVLPSATWVIMHNLGFYPNATVVDSGGSEVVGDKVYNSINEITIIFSGAFAGQAFLS